MEKYILKYCELLDIDPESYTKICDKVYQDNPKIERFRFYRGDVIGIDEDYRLTVDNTLKISGRKYIYNYNIFIEEICDLRIKFGYSRGRYSMTIKEMAILLYKGEFKAIYYHDGDISIVNANDVFKLIKTNLHKNLNVLDDI